MTRLEVALALGSNLAPRPELGDEGEPRQRAFDFALARLEAAGCELLGRSTLFETAPVDVPDEQPTYLNACVLLATQLSLQGLFELTRLIEREAGRVSKGDRRARPLDLDLVAAWQSSPLGGDQAPLGPLALPGLELPHPRAHLRRFVLAPLAELCPQRRLPVAGRPRDETPASLLLALEP